jgi:hypothetical protein
MGFVVSKGDGRAAPAHQPVNGPLIATVKPGR